MVARRTAPPPFPALVGIALVDAMLAGCTASAVEPTPERLTGDAGLLEEIAPIFGDDFDRVAVALVDGGEVRTAFVSADESTSFEIDSITMLLTGELLAIAVERGEVGLDDPVGMHLDLGDVPVASVTLRQLATHRGGVPFGPEDPAWLDPVLDALDANLDPVDDDLDDVLRLARGLELRPEPAFEYSNFGFVLLGHALAAAAGRTYAELLDSRVLRPLDMDDAIVVELDEEVPESHAGGFTPFGDPVEAWSTGAHAPAMGVHATLPDLVSFAQAVLDGPLEDSAALEPIAGADDPNRGIGYGWFTDVRAGRTITYHEGESGGFTSCFMIDRERGTAAILLSNTTSENRSRVAFGLLQLADE